jgi:hypothetical protein
MFTPLAPSAGPIGGEGLAAPPLICNFTIADNSFAMLCIYLIVQRSEWLIILTRLYLDADSSELL